MGSQNYFDREKAEECFHEGYRKQTEGKIEEAVQCYRQSLEIYPTAEAHTFLGWAYSFQRKYPEAIEECRKAIDIDPEFGNPYNDIGAYLIETGKYDEALPWLEKAVLAKRYESYCYPYYNMGRVWEKKGAWQKALECYQNSLEANADYSLALKAINRMMSFFN